MYGRTNAGNLRLFSVISVVYPVGSICTCSNGQKTLTAKNATGQWVFNVPDTGTWTVTATKGDATASRTVDISSAGQGVSIILEYALYLLDAKTQTLAEANSIFALEYSNATSIAKSNDNQHFIYSCSGGGNSWAYFHIQGVDVTKYNTLEVYGYANRSKELNRFGLLRDFGNNCTNFAAAKKMELTEQLHVLDISGLSGVFYPAFDIDRGGGSGGDKIYWKYMRLQV